MTFTLLWCGLRVTCHAGKPIKYLTFLVSVLGIMDKLGPFTESNAQTQSLSKEQNQRVLLAASRVTHFQLHFSMFKSTFQLLEKDLTDEIDSTLAQSS